MTQQAFNGPYITHIPSIKKFEINGSYSHLLLASDGLWDEVNKKELQDLFDINKFEEKNVILERIFSKAMSNIATNS